MRFSAISRHFRVSRIRAAGILALALAAAALFVAMASGGPTGAQAQQRPDDTPTPAPTPDVGADSIAAKRGSLDSMLSQMVASVEQGYASANGAASASPLSEGESVAVTFYTQGDNESLLDFLRANGGDPRNAEDGFVEAYVPLSALAAASQQAGVVRVQAIIPPQSAQAGQGAVVSQGVAAHNAAAWHEAGWRGAGVKVGILDAGFMGLSDLMGNELPANITARCYQSIGVVSDNMDDCETNSAHGSSVAETIVDVAPDASLYISNPNSLGDFRNSVRWMIEQDVDVINYSLGWTWDGPGDGTSPFADSPLKGVDTAVESGIVWASAAGNNGKTVWHGEFSNPDADGWMNFNEWDERNRVDIQAGERFIAQLRWEGEWQNANRDLDLYLLDYWGRIVARSQNLQQGGHSHTSYEILSFTPRWSATYLIAVVHASGDAPEWVQLHSFTGQQLQHYTESGGIMNPAESANPGLLAAGAAHWADTQTIQDYSSRGPAPDGRVKPDITAADCAAVSNRDAAVDFDGIGCWMRGTSQASAHIAGLAALASQAFPQNSPQDTASYLKRNADARGEVPNNVWGYGFARLPAPPSGTPVPVTPVPTPGTGTPTATPTATPSPTPTPTGGFSAFSNGANHACGIRRDGAVSCWGSNSDGQASPPSGSDFTAISAGDTHTCALRSGGAIACWGSNVSGQSGAPFGSGYTAVSSGANHACALHQNGFVNCWGSNSNGQSTPPARNDFISVSAGDANTCAMRQDGMVVCWGSVSGTFGN